MTRYKWIGETEALSITVLLCCMLYAQRRLVLHSGANFSGVRESASYSG